MKETKEFPSLIYSNTLKLKVDIKTIKKVNSKKHMDEILSKPFLKNYFSLTGATTTN